MSILHSGSENDCGNADEDEDWEYVTENLHMIEF